MRRVLTAFLMILVVLSAFAVYVGNGDYNLRVNVRVYPFGDPSAFTVEIEKSGSAYTDTPEKSGVAYFGKIAAGTYKIRVKSGSNVIVERTVTLSRSRTVTLMVPSGTVEPKKLTDLLPYSVDANTVVEVYFLRPDPRVNRSGDKDVSLRRMPLGTYGADEDIPFVAGDITFSDSDIANAYHAATGGLGDASKQVYAYLLIVKEPGYVPYELLYLRGDPSGSDKNYVYALRPVRGEISSIDVNELRVEWANKNVAINGTVKNASGDPISGAVVRVYAGRYVMAETQTDSSGNFSLSGLPEGTLTVRVFATGYRSASARFPVVENNSYTYNFVLVPRE